VPLELHRAGGEKAVMVNLAERSNVQTAFEVTGWTWHPERTVLAEVR
jgi:hypothetical protein